MVLEKPQFDPKGPPSPPLHQIDADDDNVKQLKECSSLYLALQDCLINTNRNWKSCQTDFESVEMTQDGMNNMGATSYPRAPAVLTLNETNHKQWVESITMNLTFMKTDLALRIDAPSKPADDATEKDKRFYEDWEHSNRCCLMLMRYHMNESIRDSIPKSENANDFLAAIKEKYQRFSKNEKNEHLNMLHHTIYDGSSDIRAHIDKLMGYYHKLKAMGMDLGEDYIVWLVMETIPSQFDAIRSSYNAQKKQWTVGEMSAILAKEEDMRKGRARSISMVANPNNHRKRKFTSNNSSNQKPPKKKTFSPKGNGQSGSSSTGHRNEFFKGKCNFCQNFGHKKADCRKLKAHIEKKGSDKLKKTE